MSCGPCEEKKRKEKEMTRGEFLGVGAVAAAGLGTVGMVADPRSARPPQECGRPVACGGSIRIKPWRITASLLQIIWGDLFPRLVAYRWTKGLEAATTGGSAVPPFQVGEITSVMLSNAIDGYMADAKGGAGEASPSPFRKRMQRLKTYLSGSTVIPMRFLGEGGFDFILSDAGLDLFAPEQPRDEAELLRFYQFRDTGRSTLGIPRYLSDAKALAFDVQSPGGPSQVWTDTLDVAINAPEDERNKCKLSDLSCLNLKVREEGRGKPQIGFTIQDFYASAAAGRCWQLEGAVYRGMLEQLPRIVATIWHEYATGCSASQYSYAERWKTDIGGIFKERLETSLPEHMELRRGSRLNVPPDVALTHTGITFPNVGDPDDADTNNHPPDLGAMFQEISTGAAGNPVFTDTRRPPRDE